METYLVHHGIKGQKWGVRRFQNEDGTLTNAGKRRMRRQNKEEINTSFKALREEDKAARRRDEDNSFTDNERVSRLELEEFEKATEGRQLTQEEQREYQRLKANHDRDKAILDANFDDRENLKKYINTLGGEREYDSGSAKGQRITNQVKTQQKRDEEKAALDQALAARDAAQLQAQRNLEETQAKLAADAQRRKNTALAIGGAATVAAAAYLYSKNKSTVDSFVKSKINGAKEITQKPKILAPGNKDTERHVAEHKSEILSDPRQAQIYSRYLTSAELKEASSRSNNMAALSKNAPLVSKGKGYIDKILAVTGTVSTLYGITQRDPYRNIISSMQHNDLTDEFLAHHGIKGQKWGVRRFQNEDGTLTRAGRRRYKDLEDNPYRDEIIKADRERMAIEDEAYDAEAAMLEAEAARKARNKKIAIGVGLAAAAGLAAYSYAQHKKEVDTYMNSDRVTNLQWKNAEAGPKNESGNVLGRYYQDGDKYLKSLTGNSTFEYSPGSSSSQKIENRNRYKTHDKDAVRELHNAEFNSATKKLSDKMDSAARSGLSSISEMAKSPGADFVRNLGGKAASALSESAKITDTKDWISSLPSSGGSTSSKSGRVSNLVRSAAKSGLSSLSESAKAQGQISDVITRSMAEPVKTFTDASGRLDDYTKKLMG